MDRWMGGWVCNGWVGGLISGGGREGGNDGWDCRWVMEGG